MTPSPQDIDDLARTIYGEARGESEAGQVAVAWVARNRAENPRRWPTTVSDVVRQPKQFSAWNENDPNRAKLLAVTEADPAFARARRIARDVLGSQITDPTQGADHYHARSIKPLWTQGETPTATIGNHAFYKLA